MKRLLPVVGLFLVLLIAFLVVSSSGDESSEPGVRWKIPAAEAISRIEVDRPTPLAETGREKLVLENNGGSWRMTSPIDSGLPPHFEKKLGSMFAKPIAMDDLELPTTDLKQYALDDDQKTKVSIIVPNAEPIDIEMGLGFRIDGTEATRTYVMSPGGKVYRARTDMGIVFAQPVSLMRDKSLFELEADDLNVIVIESGETTYRFVRDGSGGWEMTDPATDFDLEQPLFKTLERQLTTFRVRGFRTGGKKKWGLDEPEVTVIAGTLNGDRRLDIKRHTEDDGRVSYLAVLDRSDDVVELLPALGLVVTGDLNTFRNRITREIGRGNIRRVELAGEAGVVIERTGENEWKQVEPIPGEVSPKELGKFLGNLEMFSVIRYSDATRDEAGLSAEAKPERVVAISNDGKRHELLLGQPTDREDGVYATWADGEDVVVIPEYLYERLRPGADTLLKE